MTKKVQEKFDLIELKIRGILTEPKCWSARYFANFAINIAPKRYKLDMKYLFELEWVHMRRLLQAECNEILDETQKCAIWANNIYIGDDIALCKYLKNDGYIASDLIYSIININVKISKNAIDYCPRDVNRSYIYFNVFIDNIDIGRMLFELFSDLMPLSVEKFLKDCKKYEGSQIHRITHNGWFEAGKFNDPEQGLREKRPQGLSNCREGMLSFVNIGKSNYKSKQFIITLVPIPQLDPFQCPIGTLLDGMNVLREINSIDTYFDTPMKNVKICNVTILYAPQDVAVRNRLNIYKTTEKPANVWLQEGLIDSDVKKFRINLKPDFTQVINDLDDRINKIKIQLYSEEAKFKNLIDDKRFKYIVKNLLKSKREKKNLILFNADEVKKEKKERWFKVLTNADSDFDISYQPKGIPAASYREKELWFKRATTIQNPIILNLLKHVEKRELNSVIRVLTKLINWAINEAIIKTDFNIEPSTPSQVDHIEILGNDLAKLPDQIRDLLVEEICSLSNNGFQLFRSTLRYITQSQSQTYLDDQSTITGDVLTIINVTKSLLSIKTLSNEEMIKRKESLIYVVRNLSKSMLSLVGRNKLLKELEENKLAADNQEECCCKPTELKAMTELIQE